MPRHKITQTARLLAGAMLLGFLPSVTALGRPDGAVPIPAHKPGQIAETVEAGLALKPPQYPEQALSNADAKLYNGIFQLQEEGKIAEADALISRLDDNRLMGHVLYQRYMHPTAYKSGYEELRDWLALYGDHPGAAKIYKMANARLPGGPDSKLIQPATAESINPRHEPMMQVGKIYVSKRKRSDEQQSLVDKTKTEIMALAGDYKPTSAFKKLTANEKLFDAVEYDTLLAKIASACLYSGSSKEAAKLASAALKRSGEYVPLAGWIAGLASWQNGDYSKAASAFEVSANSKYASGWTAASSSYWAARAHMRAGNVKAVSPWLETAMSHPRTFYGLIATRSLGRDFDFNWKAPTFTKNYYDILMGIPAGNRAIALVAAGQVQKAESELIRVKPENDDMRDALLAYASYAALPSLGMRLASMVSDGEGGYYDSALYPTGPWKPEDGYKIDPALIYAIARQESRFDPSAESSSGAVGLMQVLPSTATAIDEESRLTNPQENLEIGQRYIENLLKDKNVKGDMVMLLIAYNAGPGNLAKWKKQWPEVKDPLMFIELIPSSETRNYVERVLANFWIYRLKGGQPTPTLDALATGKIAKYASKGTEAEINLASVR